MTRPELEPYPIAPAEARLAQLGRFRQHGLVSVLAARPFLPNVPLSDYKLIIHRASANGVHLVLGETWFADPGGILEERTFGAYSPDAERLAFHHGPMSFDSNPVDWRIYEDPKVEDFVRRECERSDLPFFMRSSPAIELWRRRRSSPVEAPLSRLRSAIDDSAQVETRFIDVQRVEDGYLVGLGPQDATVFLEADGLGNFEPCVGQAVTLWHTETDFSTGSQVRGLRYGNTLVFYESPAEHEQRVQLECQRFVDGATRNLMPPSLTTLPRLFQERVRRQRRIDPDYRRDREPLELLLMQEAASLMAHMAERGIAPEQDAVDQALLHSGISRVDHHYFSTTRVQVLKFAQQGYLGDRSMVNDNTLFGTVRPTLPEAPFRSGGYADQL